ncbi:sensor domain-containing diguanylate cyclase [Jeongeupia naejangsanensis]|uniref:diguanylate cyclase n=1 Tax=Jeongeupia naejangsanensis TaxID=613195 RepID=A0ABS2BPC7_9NEIS|nr:GGDEF domain-containing protein [Jeongeupia naejangsanensis]MBM3116644.1 diguanylate cyclase [Jeongeupia naejangsanensis]
MTTKSTLHDQRTGWPVHHALSNALLIGLLTFGMALLGIITRPMGLLAAFWPANAVLLGVFVRHPRTARWPSWLGALAGFVAADLLTGSTWTKSLLLTAGNFAFVLVGLLIYQTQREEIRLLRRPESIVYLVLIIVAGALAEGAVGSVINPVLFHGSAEAGFSYWFSAELANALAIVPVILALPTWRASSPGRARLIRWPTMAKWMPAAVFVASVMIAIRLNDSGSIAYPIPALLWCAISYSLFTTSLLTSMYGIAMMLSISTGQMSLGAATSDLHTLLALRIAIALIALAPLMVASVMGARNALLKQLQHLASHDPLTDALNRGGLMERADMLMRQLHDARQPVSVLMLDIDHFKSVNDQHGHATGDRVLREFARIVHGMLRDTDVFGRIGGEEFVVVLPNCGQDNAWQIAERIRAQFGQHALSSEAAVPLRATVSIGIASAGIAMPSLSTLLPDADHALYRAKHAGRNCVAAAGTTKNPG